MFIALIACNPFSIFSAMKRKEIIIIIAEYTHVTFNILIRIYKGCVSHVCVCTCYVSYVSGPTRVFFSSATSISVQSFFFSFFIFILFYFINIYIFLRVCFYIFSYFSLHLALFYVMEQAKLRLRTKENLKFIESRVVITQQPRKELPFLFYVISTLISDRYERSPILLVHGYSSKKLRNKKKETREKI